MSRTRPGPWRWLRYAYGAGLPAELDEWVRADTTGRTWVVRQMGRTMAQLAPVIIVILVFVPGPFWIRGAMVIGGTAMGMLFAMAYMVETTDHRMEKAGYPRGAAEQIRRRRADQARSEGTARRRAKIAARAARRGSW